MKKHISMFAALCVLLMTAPVSAEEAAGTETGAAAEETAAYKPGLTREEAETGIFTSDDVAAKYGIELTEGIPLYTPAEAQPLNACLVVHPDCEVGIDGDNMYPVSETGLVPAITDYLEQWAADLTEASGGAIRFVSDPDKADILVCAKESFTLYGVYSGAGLTSSGYSCTVSLTASKLSEPSEQAQFSATNTPGSTETTTGGSVFWKYPPELSGDENLTQFVNTICGWYGYEAQRGSSGNGVKAAQQAMIDRGFLADVADGSFGGKTEEAVKLLQETYGLTQTGIIDGDTLLALYYDQDSIR